MTELSLPQPYEPLSHTADAGVRVRGATAEETLGRLVLAFAQQCTGGAPAEPATWRSFEVAGGTDLSVIAVDAVRAIHRVHTTERLIPASVQVSSASPKDGARLRVGFAPFSRERYAEGLDIKAVTYHAARFEPEGGAWVAQLVFDI